ncbi:MAG: phosphotransferase, partial [Pseudomonadota bacterium]
RVGLLDFQDALLGHPAYDLTSLLRDARRDVPVALLETLLERYIARSGAEPGSFRTAFAVLGVQRQLKILGIFARLCLRDGKPAYLEHLPRVWAHLQRDLEHPALADVADWVAATLPAPAPERIATLAAEAA